MVKSCLTVYVIAFSSIILLGKSYATTTPVTMEMTARQHYRKGTKIHFQAHVRTNGSIDVSEASKPDHKSSEAHNEQSKEPKVLQTSIVPLNTTNVRKLSNDSLQQVSSYIALIDPINNVTERLEVTEKLPQSIPYSVFSNISREISNNNETKTSREKVKSEVHEKINNFIEWDVLRDYERETRIHYNGITAKETVVKTGVDEETGKRQGLKLRQLTDGLHFIQLIYNFDNEIQDCEYIRQKAAIQKFLQSFKSSIKNAQRAYESTPENVGTLDDDEDYDEYLEDDEGMIEKYSLDEDGDKYDEPLLTGSEYRNVTFQVIRNDERLPREFAEWMNYSKLKRKCRENHRILRRLAFNRKHGNELSKKLAEEHIERVKRSLDFALIFPGTKWCGKSHIAEKYTALGGFSKTDKCCRKHDYCHPLIPAFEEKYGFYNLRPYTLGHCRCDLRRKRDIMDVLLVPGTKWCGKGRRATKYTSLGGFSRTDKCCRVHDTMCPYWIGSLEEKYGLFNWRINTIMHCRCDKRTPNHRYHWYTTSLTVPGPVSQVSTPANVLNHLLHALNVNTVVQNNRTFRACLKMAKTGTANFVGKLFFNVVQTKCFVLKPQRVCLQSSWWGTCEKTEYRKKAYLKDNLSY